MAYDSNQPYNPIRSNQPTQVVSLDEVNGARHSSGEGFMWGAAKGMAAPAVYSAALMGAKKVNRNTVGKVSPLLSKGVGKVQDYAKDVTSKGSPIGESGHKNKHNSTVSGHSESEVKSSGAKPKVRSGGNKLFRAAAGLALNSSWKATTSRMAVGAVVGGSKGALHNASNGIVGTY